MASRKLSILISGASVAGPALAYWLGRAGHDVTVVERSRGLRDGGYAVDFRGEAHMGTLARMGVLDDLRALETGGGAMRFVDARNRTKLYLPPEFAGGELEVRRADLTRVLYEHSKDNVRYVFGDTISGLVQHPDRVDVTFETAPPQSYDFVFGGDGIHSHTRRLAFPGVEFERDLGYYICSWDVPGLNVTATETVCFNRPGRMIGIQPPGRDGTPPGVMALFSSEELDIGRRDTAQHKAVIRKTFAHMGWRTPELLAGLERTDDVYFNRISRAKVPDWATGRVALIGDAAGGVSIGGMGTGSAVVGAYVLAGELLANPDDYAGAFRHYQALVQPFAYEGAENGENSGRFLAPRTPWGLAIRNTLMSLPPMKRWMVAEAQKTGTAIALPEYPALAEAAAMPPVLRTISSARR